MSPRANERLSATSSSGPERIPELDALRGIAVLAAILLHASSKYPSLAAPLRRLVLGMLALSPAIRWFAALRGVNIYTNPFCRLDGLMAGAWLALEAGQSWAAGARFRRLTVGLLFLVIPLAVVLDGRQGMRSIALSFSALGAASIVHLARTAAALRGLRFLRSRFLISTGTISFGLYLLHKIPFDLAQSLQLDRYPLVLFCGGIVASYAPAGLSWRFFERPCLRWKRWFGAGSKTLAGRKQNPLAVEFTHFDLV